MSLFRGRRRDQILSRCNLGNQKGGFTSETCRILRLLRRKLRQTN